LAVRDTLTKKAVNPENDPWTSRSAAVELPGLLVDPSWLNERLGGPGLRVVDLREADAYASGHIPGAARLDLSDLGSRMGGLDNVLLPPGAFSDVMARCGISNGDAVVAYDDQWGLAAARLAWALHRYGHDRVAVLDGGWDRWVDEGRPSAQGEEPIPEGAFAPIPRAEVHADREWIARHSSRTVLLDTRTRAEFDKGHLPGALCWDWFNAVPAGGWSATRDPADLRAEWGALGVDPADEVVVYCRSGMRAAHTYLVLRNAGFSRVRLYDGSWQEWSMKTEDTGGE
jgi:thiosulfate/3-mercaptopyruvate sulfurtransferase